MAKMGTRSIRASDSPANQLIGPLNLIATGVVNLTMRPVCVPVTTAFGIVPPVLGLPIMREGFITETGFLPPQ